MAKQNSQKPFQFHSGSIKRPFLNDVLNALDVRFNSIVVRLKESGDLDSRSREPSWRVSIP